MTPEERTALLLRERLTGATAAITAPPGVAERATTGGRRRLKRRRITEGTVTALAAAAAVIAVVVPMNFDQRDRPAPAGRPDQAPTVRTEGPNRNADPYAWLYDRPARGDLRGDAGYLAAVKKVWQSETAAPARPSGARSDTPPAFLSLSAAKRGVPRVVWAGETSAGTAALVVERVTFPQGGGQAAPGAGTVAGFVGVDDAGNPRLVDADYWDSTGGSGRLGANGRATVAWFVDPERTTVSAIDLGTPLGYALGWRYQDDGVRDRDWKDLSFKDGAATFSTAGHPWWDAAVARRPYSRATGEAVIAGAFDDAQPLARSLRWGDPTSPAPIQIKGTGPVVEGPTPEETFTQALDSRLKGTPRAASSPTWTASGVLADGTQVVVSDAAVDADPSQAYAVLTKDGRSRVVRGGEVDEFGPLPVTVRLPDSLGTVVVRPTAKLAWRSSTSTWNEVGFGAALVPPDATAVRISLDGEDEQVVQLARG